jgi:ATP-dependent exoDNAse (exonuclease V) alpha subunit
MHEIRRQEVDWQREATRNLSGGAEQIKSALQAYIDHGHIYETETYNDAKRDLVEAWKRALHQDESKIILAYRNKDVADLNEISRKEMQKAGLVSNTEFTFQTVKGKKQFAAGDRLMFLRNEYSIGVKNGSLGTVEYIENGTIQVRLDTGETIAFDTEHYNEFNHGYAATVHKTQGVTVDRTFVLGSKYFDKHSTYVAMSRHRKDVRLFVSRDRYGFKTREHMARIMSRQRQKDWISDYGIPRGVLKLRTGLFERKRDTRPKLNEKLYGKDRPGKAKPKRDLSSIFQKR